MKEDRPPESSQTFSVETQMVNNSKAQANKATAAVKTPAAPRTTQKIPWILLAKFRNQRLC